MRVKSIASVALGAIAVSVAVSAAQAAPAGSVMGALKDDTAQSNVVEKATYGYGWRHDYGWRPYGYKYSYDYGWKPRYYKRYDHYGWKPHYGYGWKPHYGKYSYRRRGYGWH
jgi:hypothetical protein